MPATIVQSPSTPHQRAARVLGSLLLRLAGIGDPWKRSLSIARQFASCVPQGVFLGVWAVSGIAKASDLSQLFSVCECSSNLRNDFSGSSIPHTSFVPWLAFQRLISAAPSHSAKGQGTNSFTQLGSF